MGLRRVSKGNDGRDAAHDNIVTATTTRAFNAVLTRLSRDSGTKGVREHSERPRRYLHADAHRDPRKGLFGTGLALSHFWRPSLLWVRLSDPARLL